MLVQIGAVEELAEWAQAKGPDGSGHQLCDWWHPGTVAAILTLPFDVVKTQHQVALGVVEAVRASPLNAH